ncbi:FMN-binding negative transcriptional regulator [Phytopseudomonas dryadis]|uniref:Transcriptional regulator n=1 Tax=Phytopseudomonas dryadis TaxID=2487520 RepID=A0A4Q9QU04_9GAMM|nr:MULTISPECIES: FMN-binding negative transcriptional regulator [Pseudomonas]TBU84423.1 transcriptional regulator [Pseudomonas dryadis]TBV01530.1 transcriptional regulator [Pseudomonas dryadis]TBV19397.1 transcriptional regulator [Pseudomonas sp. FRB 230]
MYSPPAFRQDDVATLQREIGGCRLATLISHGPEGLQASHLPLLLRTDQGPLGTLYGHLARANPHWRALAAGAQVLVVFNGPEAYVSPSWYAQKAEHGKVVPTWNYIAVHAHGRAEVFDEPERLLQLLRDLTDHHESPRPQPWAVDDAPRDYLDGMLRAIVGFALPISRLEGKYKLSQNRAAADRQGVRNGLGNSPDQRDRALAQRMAP